MLKNSVNELKNASIADLIKQKKESVKMKTGALKLSSQRRTQEKRIKKVYMIYMIPSKGPICELLHFQKEKRVRREQEV